MGRIGADEFVLNLTTATCLKCLLSLRLVIYVQWRVCIDGESYEN